MPRGGRFLALVRVTVLLGGGATVAAFSARRGNKPISLLLCVVQGGSVGKAARRNGTV